MMSEVRREQAPNLRGRGQTKNGTESRPEGGDARAYFCLEAFKRV